MREEKFDGDEAVGLFVESLVDGAEPAASNQLEQAIFAVQHGTDQRIRIDRGCPRHVFFQIIHF